MQTVFVQPYSQQDPGGSSRIFSSLIENRQESVSTIVFGPSPLKEAKNGEFFLPERTIRLARLENTRFRPLLVNLWPLSWQRCSGALGAALTTLSPSHVHAIAHGLGFYPAWYWAVRRCIGFSLTVHDDIRHLFQGNIWLGRIETWLEQVWCSANHRFVISPEIGEEYCRRYGERPWMQVTDGMDDATIALGPRPTTANRLRLYFAGGLNVPYEPNFLALQHALKTLQADTALDQARLILRGGRRLRGEDPDAPPFEVRPFAPQTEVLRDLDEVDVLYLPLSIDPKYANFAKFSLSTKMITYLGSGLPIFYHGPEDSAAYQLLRRHDACIACFSNDPQAITATLRSLPQHRERIIRNALDLARREFRIEDIRERFWGAIRDSVTASRDSSSTVA